MTIRIEPIKDERGILRPDLDYRDVPISVMALYLGVDPATVHRRMQRGDYPMEGIKRNGTYRLYKPCVIVGAQVLAR